MKSVSLKAYPRQLAGRNSVKKLRTGGRIPAVIYGRGVTAQTLEVEIDDLDEAIHHSASENVLVDLALDGDARPKRLALVQEVQHHPLSGQVLHVDFHEVKPDEKVTIMVPVESVGEAVGVKTGGGVLEHVLFKLRVRALPKDLPELINVDVTSLELGKSIHIGEITVPEGVEILGRKEAPVLTVAAPKTEEQEAAEAAAAATPGEVEMIKEKKEEGAEGAAPAKKEDKAGDKGAAKPAAEKGAEKKPEKK